MRRALPRTLVPLVIVAALAVGIAPAASAHVAHPQSIAARVQARLTSLLHGSSFRPSMGNAASPAIAVLGGGATLGGGFHIPGSPYHWGVGVSRTGGAFALYVVGARNIGFGQGYELHQWGFALPRGDAAIGAALHTGHIHTGEALGPFGKIDLTFGSARRIKPKSFPCGSGKARITYAYARRGTLKGSLSFTSNEGSLPDLHISHLRALIERPARINPKDFKCGSTPHPQPHHHHKAHCYARTDIDLTDRSQDADVEFYGPNEIDVSTFNQTATSFESHDLSISGFTRIVHVTSSGLTVDASGFAPFLTGAVAFEAASATGHRGPACEVTHTRESWSSGTVTANLDSGSIDLTGSDAVGRVIVHKRP